MVRVTARTLNLPGKKKGVLVETKAALLKRIAAFALDIFILNLTVFFPFKKILSKLIGEPGNISEVIAFFESNPELGGTVSKVALAAISIAFLYFVITQRVQGQTLGQMVMKIYVKSERKKRKSMTLWDALLRNIFIFPYFPFIILWVLEPAYMLFSKNGQTLLERFSKTKTLEKVMVE